MNICMISLGCDKNLSDSEMMLGFLKRKNVFFTDDPENADVVIINTCCFILDAKKESIETILRISRLKRENKIKALIVTGCLAERYREEIRKEIPEVDAIVGTSGTDRIETVLKKVLKGKKENLFEDLNRLPAVSENRVPSSLNGVTGYLKIAEGCDKHCTYCIIPDLRGKYRSYPIETLLDQAKKMAAEGIRELILVAQETTLYGTDLYGRKSLDRLLTKLCAIRDLKWIRILYCYPEEITESLIRTIQKEDKICKALDMPIQHASNPILKKMGRKTDQEEITGMIGRLRSEIPGISLRTTLISGFPGETEADHKELVKFVKQMKFDRLGVFPYSREENTPAYFFPDQIPSKVKKQRRNEIMAVQQKISASLLKKKKGKVIEVLVEGYLPKEKVYIGRSAADAPDVDGTVFFTGDREYLTGEFVRVKISGSSEYDLEGRTV